MLRWLRNLFGGGTVARGVLPTRVTDSEVILCKRAPRVRATYEIRLCLFMAADQSRTFVLAVPPETDVAPDARELIREHGGEVRTMSGEHFTVYVGHADATDSPQDGWVLGDEDAWHAFRTSLRSEWLREQLVPGAVISGAALARLESDLAAERVTQENVDGENVADALRKLLAAARESRGSIFIQ